MHIQDMASATVKGPGHPINQDAVVVLTDPHLAVVADGMGGPGAGNIASSMAVVAFQERAAALTRLADQADSSSRARLALGREMERISRHIHDQISQTARQQARSTMGATLVAALIAGNRAHLANVGAARAYLFRNGRLRALTEDHTVGMARVRQGLMPKREYRTSPLRQQLYQALGTGADVDVDVAEVALADGDRLLLCTDGVHNAIDDLTLTACLAGAKGAEAATQAVMSACHNAGATDDASVAVLQVASGRSASLEEDIATVLAETFLFRGLSETERVLVAPYLDHASLDPTEVLFHEGDEADAFFVVVDGAVRITKGGTPLVDVGPGGSFGELCLARPVTRSATVTAISETLIMGLSRGRFHEVLARRPIVGGRLLLAALDHVGMRLRDVTDRLARVQGLASGKIDPQGRDLAAAITAASEGKER